LGVAGCPFSNAEAGPAVWGTTFMKFVKDREVLFDTDRNGIPFNGNNTAATVDEYKGIFSLIGPGTEILMDTGIVMPGDPLMFDPPLRFEAGAELSVYLSIVKTSTPTWDGIEDVAFILRDVRS
ncbi:hypothetical protein LCGC14_1095280, partial [marine sediment metagenome]